MKPTNVQLAFLNNETINWKSVLSPMDDEKEDWKKYQCKFCNKVLNGHHEWNMHVTSKSHKKRKASLKKRELNEMKRLKMDGSSDQHPDQ